MKKILLLIIIFISCKKTNEDVIVSESFELKLNNYIQKYPTRIIKNRAFKSDVVIPDPSYHVFFERYNNDTIISIKLSPFLVGYSPFEMMLNEANKNLLFNEKNASGLFFYKDSPIIVFDENNLSNKILKKINLINNIPDSLKWDFGEVNRHLKSKSEFYKLNKLELNKFEL